MKLVVLGATRGVGLEIIRQAIEPGHAVTAFVRSPDRLKALSDRITLLKGKKGEANQCPQVRGQESSRETTGRPRR